MRRVLSWCAACALIALALGLTAAHVTPGPGSGAFAGRSRRGAGRRRRPCRRGRWPSTPRADELDTLPGVGEVIAQRIIEEREQNGPFYYPEDLMNVKGIGEKTLEKLLPHIRLP